MPNPNSERVMKARKKSADRVSILIDKNGKYLLRAQALREGVSVAEMMRRAILARCGLSSMPNIATPHYHAIISAEDKKSADKAIEGLQLDEYVERVMAESKKEPHKRRGDNIFLTVYLSSEEMKKEYIQALQVLLNEVKEAPARRAEPIRMDTKNLAVIRRLLSNIEEVAEYPDN